MLSRQVSISTHNHTDTKSSIKLKKLRNIRINISVWHIVNLYLSIRHNELHVILAQLAIMIRNIRTNINDIQFETQL